jgi:hypothetical protein
VTAAASVVRGAGVVRRAWRVWLLVWAVTLGFALLLAAPAAAVLYGRLGHSLYAGRLFDNFDVQWLAELRLETGNSPFLAAAPAIVLVSGGYLLLLTFLYGGALPVFAGRGEFWPGCARNFRRLLRLLILSLACYAAVYAVYLELGKAGYGLWGQGMVERPVAIFGWFRAGVALLLFLFLNMVFDYAKIRLVSEDHGDALAAARDSFRFVARHPAATVGTYALVSIVAAALAAVYWMLSGALPRTALAWLALVFLVQQAFVAGRVWVKLLYLAAEMEVAKRFAGRAISPDA